MERVGQGCTVSLYRAWSITKLLPNSYPKQHDHRGQVAGLYGHVAEHGQVAARARLVSHQTQSGFKISMNVITNTFWSILFHCLYSTSLPSFSLSSFACARRRFTAWSLRTSGLLTSSTLWCLFWWTWSISSASTSSSCSGATARVCCPTLKVINMQQGHVSYLGGC